MAVLAQPVALGDVLDIEAFAQATINRSRRRHEPDEREELVAEALRISYDLWSRYDPHRAGYEHEGRFSGFLAKFLPLKLEDAYHRLHPEHMLRNDPETGKRSYVYGERAASLDAMTAEDPDRQPLLAGRPDESDVRSKVARALDERWARKREAILDVADLLGQGASGADAAAMLGLTSAQVHEAVGEIMLVADKLRSDAE